MKNIFRNIKIIIIIIITSLSLFAEENECKYKDEKITPLIEAIQNNDIEKIKLLIKNNYDINKDLYEGDTALMHAIGMGNEKIIDLLLDAGANVNVKNENGLTALHLAAASLSYGDFKLGHRIILELIKKGADINAKANDGETIVHKLLTELYYKAAEDYKERLQETIKIINELVALGFDINAKDNEGKTPLHMAASVGEPELIEKIINLGANINAEDNYGFTPIHQMDFNGTEEELDSIDIFIKYGYDINRENIGGVTILMDAVLFNDLKAVKYLISKGANVNAKSKSGETAISRAIENKNIEIIKELLKAGAIAPVGFDIESIIESTKDSVEDPDGDRFYTKCPKEKKDDYNNCFTISSLLPECSIEEIGEFSTPCFPKPKFLKLINKKTKKEIIINGPNDLKGCINIKTPEEALDYLRFFSSFNTAGFFDEVKYEVYKGNKCFYCLKDKIWSKFHLHEPLIVSVHSGYEITRYVVKKIKESEDDKEQLFKIIEFVSKEGEVKLIKEERINANEDDLELPKLWL